MTGWMMICERNVCRRRGLPAHDSSGHMVNNHMTVIAMMECYSLSKTMRSWHVCQLLFLQSIH